jgi:hypothetical protein
LGINSKDSIPPMIKQEWYWHKMLLYKKDSISSFEVSLLHNNMFWAIGICPVKYLYNWNNSFSSLLQE